ISGHPAQDAMPLNFNYLSRPRRSTAARTALDLLLALAFVVLTGLVDGGTGVAPLRMLDQPRFPLVNALPGRSEEHTSELQSLMRISYAVFCLTKNRKTE